MLRGGVRMRRGRWRQLSFRKGSDGPDTCGDRQLVDLRIVS